MIIDCTYFTGLLSVGIGPDTGAPSVTREAEKDRINTYIDIYEIEYLNNILGDDVCSEFVSYLESREDSVENGKSCMHCYQRSIAL